MTEEEQMEKSVSFSILLVIPYPIQLLSQLLFSNVVQVLTEKTYFNPFFPIYRKRLVQSVSAPRYIISVK